MSMISYIGSVVLMNSSLFQANQLIDIITNGTDAIILDGLSKYLTYTFTRNSTGSLSVAVDAIYVRHLDNIATIDFLRPISQARTESFVSFEGLVIEIALSYNLTLNGSVLSNPETLEQSGYASLSLPLLSGTVDIDFDVSSTNRNHLHAESFYNPGCVASAIRAAQISLISTDLQASNASLIVSDDKGINSLVNGLLLLGLGPFSRDIPLVRF